jgi:hypothetical protein
VGDSRELEGAYMEAVDLPPALNEWARDGNASYLSMLTSVLKQVRSRPKIFWYLAVVQQQSITQ